MMWQISVSDSSAAGSSAQGIPSAGVPVPGVDELKAKMQQMQEQHGKQIRNLQGIHNQELETKDKEISRLNTILEKVKARKEGIQILADFKSV